MKRLVYILRSKGQRSRSQRDHGFSAEGIPIVGSPSKTIKSDVNFQNVMISGMLSLTFAALTAKVWVLGLGLENLEFLLAFVTDLAQVKEVLPSFSEYLRGTALQQREGKVADMQIHYHVEGDINAAYSEILLSRLCGGGWPNPIRYSILRPIKYYFTAGLIKFCPQLMPPIFRFNDCDV